MSLEQKIVYTGLSRMTQDRVVIQNAFQYWLANFSGKAFDVVEVTVAIDEYLGLNSQEKKTLMISLHAASNKTDSELSDVPAYMLQTGANVPPADSDAVESNAKTFSPHVHITSQFIQLLADTTKRLEAAGYREIDEILKDEGLLELDKTANQQVVRSGFSEKMLITNANEGECRELAHQLYLLIIDVIGPVQADVAVNQVIEKMLGSDMASRFDPRSLI